MTDVLVIDEGDVVRFAAAEWAALQRNARLGEAVRGIGEGENLSHDHKGWDWYHGKGWWTHGRSPDEAMQIEEATP